MATTASILRNKRSQNPRKVFSPTTASVPLPSNYLIYMDETVSYLIVARSSIKFIQGKMATIIINKKKLVGEIIVAGTYERCQSELNKAQKALQSDDATEIDEYELEENDLNHNTDVMELDPTCNGSEKDSDDEYVEYEDFTLPSQNTNKKRKIKSSNTCLNDSRPKKLSKNDNSDEAEAELDSEGEIPPSSTTTKQHNLSQSGNSFKILEQKMNGVSKNLLKINHVINQLASASSKTGSHNFDCYRDPKSQETFPTNVEFNNVNLLATIGRDFGDFARQTMRILYSTNELRTCILPPNRQHLSRPALDPDRFRLLNDAVRIKYRLTSYLYDEFYKYHLSPKLSDFLVEERRREMVKNARRAAKNAVFQQTSGSTTTNEV